MNQQYSLPQNRKRSIAWGALINECCVEMAVWSQNLSTTKCTPFITAEGKNPFYCIFIATVYLLMLFKAKPSKNNCHSNSLFSQCLLPTEQVTRLRVPIAFSQGVFQMEPRKNVHWDTSAICISHVYERIFVAAASQGIGTRVLLCHKDSPQHFFF